eukprot:607271-Rhodomonas_salina.1
MAPRSTAPASAPHPASPTSALSQSASCNSAGSAPALSAKKGSAETAHGHRAVLDRAAQRRHPLVAKRQVAPELELAQRRQRAGAHAKKQRRGHAAVAQADLPQSSHRPPLHRSSQRDAPRLSQRRVVVQEQRGQRRERARLEPLEQRRGHAAAAQIQLRERGHGPPLDRARQRQRPRSAEVLAVQEVEPGQRRERAGVERRKQRRVHLALREVQLAQRRQRPAQERTRQRRAAPRAKGRVVAGEGEAGQVREHVRRQRLEQRARHRGALERQRRQPRHCPARDRSSERRAACRAELVVVVEVESRQGCERGVFEEHARLAAREHARERERRQALAARQ